MILALWLACVADPWDQDGDGHPLGADCDDESAEIGLPTPYYPDRDGDFAGDPLGQIVACSQPERYLERAGDCDDLNPDTHPGALELCDFQDNDCDGEVDERAIDAELWFPDVDGDTWGDDEGGLLLCRVPEGWVETPGDCDDYDPLVNPDGEEVDYDGVDGDCDGWSDFDADHDGFVSDAYGGVDCDDGDAGAFPGAFDLCRSGFDEACDGVDATECRYWEQSPIVYQRGAVVGDLGSGVGASAAALGDTDGDGASDFAVGAPAWSEVIFQGGAVYVSSGPPLGRVILPDDAVTYEDLAPVTSLGSAVARVGDVDGDGLADLAVAASAAGVDLDERGDVRVILAPFDEASFATPWLVLPGEDRDDRAGTAMVSGDLERDGEVDLIIGAPLGGPTVSGVVYVVGTQQIGLQPLGSSGARWAAAIPGEEAGAAVAIVGDTDGDGLSDVVVGAPGAPSASGAFDAGRAYLVRSPAPDVLALPDADAVYSGTHGAEELDLLGEVAGARLGERVAGGDIDGDGRADVVVAAPFDSDRRLSGGRVFVFSGSLDGPVDVVDAALTVLPEHEADQVGAGVATGDFDGDGWVDLAVGAPFARGSTLVRTGWVSVFRGPLTGDRYIWDSDGRFFGSRSGDQVGASLFTLGDLDGDGATELGVGGVDILYVVYGEPYPF
jgi:hypothetical protein